ncbi:Fe-S cluster assembly protein SufD [bacterium]|nr:Fe-S cluster assembly protein SufD [bacterium]
MIAIDAPFAQIIKETDDLAASLGEPSAAADIRRDGMVAARTLPQPDRRREEWKRSNPDRFLPDFSRPFVLADDRIELGFLSETSELQRELQELGVSLAAEDKESRVRFETAGEAIETPELTVSSLSAAFRKDSQPPAGFFRAEQHQKDLPCALNAALRTGGAYVKIKPEAALKRPLCIKHRVGFVGKEPDGDQQRLFFSHSLIEALNPCKAVIIEDFTSVPGQAFKAGPLIEIDLSQGAEVTYVMIGGWDKEVSCLNNIHVRLGKDASLKIIFAGIGGSLTKTFFSEDLNQPGAHTEIYGIIMASGAQFFDNDTFIHHKAPSCYSNVLFNCAVDGQARTVFAGNILVDGCAQLTDAYQKNQNLLLSEDAKAESMPKLEIIADDVRCTHGASFTEHDENQLFYLQSRGLSEKEAKNMLVEGFFGEIIQKTGNPSAAEWLSERLAEKM